ncbi:cyanophycinase [Mucilaginibacter sp. PAMB04274]|uniref:cyanophycinase n=1 Tax=Mucilaginibacter sp. PAMB04274 TaxID=3138568 RepID=UPI0031F69663
MEENNTCPVPNGTLLIIGGAEAKEDNQEAEKNDSRYSIGMEVLSCFVNLLEAEHAIVEVITSASSSEPEESFKNYERSFKDLGVYQINHIHHDNRADVKLDELEERLTAAHGVFIAGGDQLKLTAVYGGTDVLLLLKQRYIHDRLIIAGTSAGAMAMSTPMIYQGVGRDEMIAGNVKITTGLEFLRDVCIDTHFVNRGRFVRMSQVIATNPTSIGVGIEEDTAMIVRNGKEAEVVGCGVLIVINGYESHGTNIHNHGDDEPLTIRGLNVDILSKGEKFIIPELNPPHK